MNRHVLCCGYRFISLAGRKLGRCLLIAAVIMGLRTLPVQAQIVDAQVAAFVEALRRAAPQTGIENDGLFSEWQVKMENIVRWSKRCTGELMTPAEFEANPEKARYILMCVMGKILREQYTAAGGDESVAVRRAASWWMTGDPALYDSDSARPYTQKVLYFYREVL